MIDSRKAFVQRALAVGANLSLLCRQFGITRKTGRLWRERAREAGLHALADRSRRPLHSPGRLQEEEVCHLVLLKSAWPHWGPKKICQLYEENRHRPLSVSSCHRILKACGLVATRKQRVHRPTHIPVVASVPREPNDVWTVDFKGWWRTRDGRRCEPLTVRDAFSRYVLAAHLPADGRTETIDAEMNRLFRQHGLPKVIKSDNGAPFASVLSPLGLTKLSARWVALGIQLEHSRPAHPQDNGGHERVHRDIETEVAAHTQIDAATQQAALEVWRHDHNHIRPHERLQGRRPAQLYGRSPRCWPKGKIALDYGPGYLPRMVNQCGMISYRGRQIFISTVLSGWQVGLRLRDSDTAEVWFNYLLLGVLNFQTLRFVSAPSRSVKAHGLAA